MSNENIKSWPVQLYCRSELGTDYWTAHLTQCNDEIEYIRSDLVEQMQIEAAMYRWLKSKAVWRPSGVNCVTWDVNMTEPDIRAGVLTESSVGDELDAAILEDLNILETMEDCLLWVEHEEDRARMESCIKIMQGRLK